MELLDLEYQFVDVTEHDYVIVVKENAVFMNKDYTFLRNGDVEGDVQ